MSKVKKQAAVLFISGQSNAHAHGQKLEEHNRITEPLCNVFSLDRNPNQSLDITDVVWSGFTGAGKNLGESQDHTCSFAYYFAKMWQGAIDTGLELPDLYIVQISVGGQGIMQGMWNPSRDEILIPGDLSTVHISLFPLAVRVNRLVMENLRKQEKEPIVLGWHWIGSEADRLDGAYNRENFRECYDYFFDKMLESIGAICPIYLYKLYLKKFCDVQGTTDKGVNAVNIELYRQCKKRVHTTVVEAEQCPYWDEKDEHMGIFGQDNIHYLGSVQEWFATRFFEEIKNNFKEKGILTC